MAIFHGNSIPAGGSGSSYYDYEINNSLRFNKDNNPHLTHPNSFSPTSPYTVSCWVKRGKISGNNYVYRINSADAFNFGTSDTINLERRGGSFQTSRVFRDTSAWYHMVVKSTSSDFKLYINGVLEQTGTATANPYSAGTFHIGNIAPSTNASYAFDGYMAEWHWVDGQALGPENFGEVGTYGDWKPIEYTGSHGSTGFYLDFSNSSALGNDASANSNHFTVNNITASDQVKDSPTNNFPVMNNLNNQPFATTFAEGNLQMTTGGQGHEPSNMATMGMTSGKWYFEVCQSGGGQWALIGIRGTQAGTLSPEAKDNPGKAADGYALLGKGTHSGAQNIVNSGVYVSYGTKQDYGNGDVISVAVDLDNNKCYWAKNGVYINSANPSTNSNGFSILPVEQTSLGAYFPCFGDYDASSYVFNCNFGQDGTFAGNVTAGGNADENGYGNFKYSVPSGFLSLCTANLAEPTVIPSEHFNTLALTGNSSTNRNVTGVGFQPDLVWGKQRASVGRPHGLFDSVRGGGYRLRSDDSTAETYNATDFIRSFTADGFTVGQDESFNQSGSTYAFWNWKAGGAPTADNSAGAGATPTAGSVKIDGVNLGSALAGTLPATGMSANTTAGFSITKYAGTGNEVKTVAHGLSVAPNLVIIKRREDSAHGWSVGTIQPLGSRDFTDTLFLHDNSVGQDDPVWWNDTAPSSTVVTIGTNSWVNNASKNFIMYCFHSVEGFSKIGAYKGTMNTDGGFVYLGFRPAWVLIKAMGSAQNWVIFDNKRDTNNPMGKFLFADAANTETTQDPMLDFLSNGMKMRRADSWHNNTYSDGYLYYAIAEQPFKHTNAR